MELKPLKMENLASRLFVLDVMYFPASAYLKMNKILPFLTALGLFI